METVDAVAEPSILVEIDTATPPPSRPPAASPTTEEGGSAPVRSSSSPALGTSPPTARKLSTASLSHIQTPLARSALDTVSPSHRHSKSVAQSVIREEADEA